MLRITPLAIRPGESLGLSESETATAEVGSPARGVGFHGHIILPPPCKDGRQKQERDQAAIAKAAERETDPAAIWTLGSRANSRPDSRYFGAVLRFLKSIRVGYIKEGAITRGGRGITFIIYNAAGLRRYETSGSASGFLFLLLRALP